MVVAKWHVRRANQGIADYSGANYVSLANINLLLILAGFATMIEICQVKYLNNIIEQDHRFIKKITKPMTLRENTRPYRYHGLKIFTSLKLRFQDFQRMKNALSSGITILLKL
jgi:transposase-like protein